MSLTDLDPAEIVDDTDATDLELLCEAMTPSALDPDWHARLLDDVSHVGRFERFVGDVAELLGIDLEGARRHLDALSDATRWVPGFLPGMSLIHLERSPKLSPAIAGLVRLPTGTQFPDHEHFGVESVLVIQGSGEDSGRIFRPGDRLTMPAGSHHSFVVRPGPDLVYLAVVERGLRVGDLVLLADDDRI